MMMTVNFPFLITPEREDLRSQTTFNVTPSQREALAPHSINRLHPLPSPHSSSFASTSFSAAKYHQVFFINQKCLSAGLLLTIENFFCFSSKKHRSNQDLKVFEQVLLYLIVEIRKLWGPDPPTVKALTLRLQKLKKCAQENDID